MQTITTKYLGATNHKPSRVKATTTSGISLTMSWAHELNINANHEFAAKKLAEKLGWSGQWFGGSTKDGQVFVCVGKREPDFTVEKKEDAE